MEVKLKLLSPKLGGEIPLPGYATDGAAGLDLRACIDAPLVLQEAPGPGNTAVVPTGLAISLPGPEWAAFLFARSGLAVKHGVTLSNGVGVIDSDYRGEIKVGLVNLGAEPYTIEPGERLAQLVLMPVGRAELVLAQELDDTARGAGGFGSTGRE